MIQSIEGPSGFLLMVASIAFFHTLFGPDHYVPFSVMARARGWSAVKTTWVTVLCGAAHLLSSVLLGTVGIALGIAVSSLEALESVRGNIAGWGLIVLGLLYFVWGLRHAIRNRPHTHFHFHEDDEVHAHTHVHHGDHVHVHENGAASLTPWVLFTVFVFGPCEPLIPLVIYPAAQGSWRGVVWVTVVFGATTIATMLGLVLASTMGLRFVRLGRMERYSHALAGASICVCGIMVQFLAL